MPRLSTESGLAALRVFVPSTCRDFRWRQTAQTRTQGGGGTRIRVRHPGRVSDVLRECLTHERARSTSTGQTNYVSFYLIIALAILLLPCPEHHVRFPRKTQSSDAELARNPFPFLKLEIISRDDMGKQCLDFIDSKESSGTDSRLDQRS
jgi:hypothetical protein